ncbi:hypothetical protein BJ085DRAFT_30069 [Dimargaris cristalligena]|uniref:Uncharacterized protein n=1 Tax=Dimargaris cristalligena TaxID=215637 RepID=A0A4P9ZZV0_9FUNG|nr:hypothetical protein BJ085DRAFT_30069 [Dimargaris cristalligena]|eukprot:RKP38671.1 hypothetical protein BJ085DRAFT_30069 [Dimargaris cristalligena]
MRLGEIIYPLLATHFTAFNSPLNPTKQSPNASEAKWVKQFLALPDLVRNPAADVIVKQLSLSAYVWWAPALLNTSPKDLPLLNEKANTFVDQSVKYFNPESNRLVDSQKFMDIWLAGIPLEATNAIVEGLSGSIDEKRRSVLKILGRGLGLKSHPDKIVGLNIGNPLFTRANWKYVNLAKIGLLEFTRHFPLAQAATANLLGLIVTLKPAKDLDTNIIWETRVALNQSDFEVYIGDQNDHAKFERTMRLGAL